jgi:hypothetical protein
MGDDAAILEIHFKKLVDWQIAALEFGNPEKISERRRARNNLQILIQGLLHRSISLLQAVSPMIERANVYGLGLICRGHIESTAQLGYFCDQLTALKNRNITFDHFHERLACALMGAAHPIFKDAPKPLNVMTYIEKADRHLTRFHKLAHEELINDCYSWLSDLCHPNFLSSSSSFIVDNKKNEFIFRNELTNSPNDCKIIFYLAISSDFFALFFKDICSLTDVLVDRI